ncbi:hypothetical protein JHK85_004477 [Glycine max]|nr:hypothetical protein JHK85_004477 [Glycine max]KAG5080237.1 hypothetical protein JHK86_004302 [Glycine max]
MDCVRHGPFHERHAAGVLGRGWLCHGSVCYLHAVSTVDRSCRVEGTLAVGGGEGGAEGPSFGEGVEDQGAREGRGEVVGGGSEEDEVVSGGDGQDGEAAGEERGVATEEKVVEGSAMSHTHLNSLSRKMYYVGLLSFAQGNLCCEPVEELVTSVNSLRLVPVNFSLESDVMLFKNAKGTYPKFLLVFLVGPQCV